MVSGSEEESMTLMLSEAAEAPLAMVKISSKAKGRTTASFRRFDRSAARGRADSGGLEVTRTGILGTRAGYSGGGVSYSARTARCAGMVDKTGYGAALGLIRLTIAKHAVSRPIPKP